VIGLLFYMVGALAMVFAQGLAAIIVFWAVVGGLGASLYLPAMQSLIHGNFEGKERAKVFALIGASGAVAAAIGPLIGGFVTTAISWRGVRGGGPDHRDRPRREPARARRAVRGRAIRRRRRRGPVRDRHGRPHRRRSPLAGGRRVGRGTAGDRHRHDDYALSPISEERVGEAAGVTSATGSFGLSFWLAFAGAIMLATLSISFTNMAESSTVLPPADQQHVADVLEDDAQVMSDAQLEQLLQGQPEAIQDEILSINTDARHIALQAALLFTLLASVIGVAGAFRMMRLPDPQPSGAAEEMALA
jgi:hypothetical protein